MSKMKNKTDMTLTVSEIQRFCMHDGPGIRTTVFLKGCPLDCHWCHNPEAKHPDPQLLFYEKKCIGCGACTDCPQQVHQISDGHRLLRSSCVSCGECAAVCPTKALELCGIRYTVDELVNVLDRDRAFFGETGGVTLSGGEPLLQGDAVVSLHAACKERGLSTAVETCGHVPTDLLRAAVPYVDLFLWDVKDTDPVRHKQYTGVDNTLILHNLSVADDMGAKTRLRCILINGVNTQKEHYRRLGELAGRLHHCEGVELIPYHAYGGTKATFLGHPDNGRADWIPSEEQVRTATHIIRAYDVNVT